MILRFSSELLFFLVGSVSIGSGISTCGYGISTIALTLAFFSSDQLAILLSSNESILCFFCQRLEAFRLEITIISQLYTPYL
jgi:hypothetical protein